MSNSESNKKTTKKPNNSYSLLLKGFSEVRKSKPPQSSSSFQKSRTPESMTSLNDYQENSSNNDKSGDMQDPDIPDRSYGDYYCKLCDSHMNSDNMWDAHVTGKRHLKNVKKGDTDSKYEDLPDVESSIKYELRNVKDPVVGLSYIHEIRRKEANVPPIYNCFLCHASIATVPLVTEHVISLKHRLNYIKENNPEEYQLIEATNLKKGHMEPLVVEAARAMEQKVGRGTVKVKQEKKKNPVITYSAKKTFNIDDDNFDEEEDDDSYRKSYKNSKFDNNSSVWKSVDTGKGFGRRERSRSPRDYGGKIMSRSRSRSPRDFKDRKRNLYLDEDHSVGIYKRPFSKRDISPRPDNYDKHRSFSKRDISPEHDYHHFRSNDDYLQPSRKNDSRSNYTAPRYEHANPRESAKKSFNSFDQPKSSSSFAQQENYLPTRERSVDKPSQPKSVDNVFQDTLLLSSQDCYDLFFLRLKSLPEITNIGEMISLTRLISEAQKKLKTKLSEQLVSALLERMQKSDNTANVIPGLGDGMSTSVEPHGMRPDNSRRPTDAENFINNIFKSANYSPLSKLSSQDKSSFPYSLPSPYAPVINSQQTALVNPLQAPSTNYQVPANNFQAPSTSYQAPPSSYQTPPSNSYQGASTTSYSNQGPYQHPNNLPFSSGSNFLPNISGLNPAAKPGPRQQVYNYAHFSSTSKKFPHKY